MMTRHKTIPELFCFFFQLSFVQGYEGDAIDLLDNSAGAWDTSIGQDMFEFAEICTKDKKERPNMIKALSLLEDILNKLWSLSFERWPSIVLLNSANCSGRGTLVFEFNSFLKVVREPKSLKTETNFSIRIKVKWIKPFLEPRWLSKSWCKRFVFSQIRKTLPPTTFCWSESGASCLLLIIPEIFWRWLQ